MSARLTSNISINIMFVRKATTHDAQRLAELDDSSYPGFGLITNDVLKKIKSVSSTIYILEKEGSIIGFIVLDFINPNELPESFVDLKTDLPSLKTSKWVNISAFTTISNFKDYKTDTFLLSEVENIVRYNFNQVCVPLTIEHPYDDDEHKVFSFWQKNGYSKIGTINWITKDKTKKFPCYFFAKDIRKT